MKTIAIAIEGVIAREPLPETFAAAAVIIDGMWLKSVIQEGAWVVMATGCTDKRVVDHWLATNGISGSVEYPTVARPGELMVTRRLSVFDRLSRQNRGNLTVIDSSRLIRDAMVSQGVMVLQPWFGRHRAEVDDDDFAPLRQVPNFWEK